jgi:hypothetical protein
LYAVGVEMKSVSVFTASTLVSESPFVIAPWKRSRTLVNGV